MREPFEREREREERMRLARGECAHFGAFNWHRALGKQLNLH